MVFFSFHKGYSSSASKSCIVIPIFTSKQNRRQSDEYAGNTYPCDYPVKGDSTSKAENWMPRRWGPDFFPLQNPRSAWLIVCSSASPPSRKALFGQVLREICLPLSHQEKPSPQVLSENTRDLGDMSA